MDFKLHKDFSAFDPATWNALVEQSIADTPFSRYEYLSEWWKTRGGGEWKSAESPRNFLNLTPTMKITSQFKRRT